MYNLLKIVPVVLICMLAVACKQDNVLQVEIAPWFENKEAAVSLTFDDGTDDQLFYAVPLLEEVQLKGTFYLITSQIKDLPAWQKVCSEGHEIGSHSVRHHNLKQLDKKSARKELKISYENIKELFPSQKCFSISYPFGGVNDAIERVAYKYYTAGRSARKSESYINTYDNMNLFELRAFGVSDDSQYDEITAMVEDAIKNGGWLIETVHGIKNPEDKQENIPQSGWKPIHYNILNDHYHWLKQNHDRLWIAPLSTVARYVHERRNTVLLWENKSSDTMQVQLHNTDSETRCLVPLTLNITLKEDIAIHLVEQKDIIIPHKCNENICWINILPGGRPILFTLTRSRE